MGLDCGVPLDFWGVAVDLVGVDFFGLLVGVLFAELPDFVGDPFFAADGFSGLPRLSADFEDLSAFGVFLGLRPASSSSDAPSKSIRRRGLASASAPCSAMGDIVPSLPSTFLESPSDKEGVRDRERRPSAYATSECCLVAKLAYRVQVGDIVRL